MLDTIALIVLIAAFVGVGLVRAARRRRAPMTRDELLKRIEAFPREHRAEAKELVEHLAAAARPEQRDQVRRMVLKRAKGDIGRLRESAATMLVALETLYRQLGVDRAEVEALRGEVGGKDGKGGKGE